MDYSFIIAVIPVILVVAFLVWIAKKITDGERLDMKEGVLGVVILMVAVLIMVPMVSSTQVYTWDEDNGKLVIQQNISGGVYAWDTYDDQIRSIVIEPGVTQIGNSAFDGATNLEYLSIPDTVTDIGTNAFGVALKDYLDQTISTPEAGEYVGTGNGTLYLAADVFAYNSSGTAITGLASEFASAKNIVFPYKHEGVTVTSVNDGAFQNNTVIAVAFSVPDSKISTLALNTFNGCTSLVAVSMPEVTTVAANTVRGCTSLSSFDMPKITNISNNMFYGCTSLTSLYAPVVASIGTASLYGCTSLASIYAPVVASIGATSGNGTFQNCADLESIDFPLIENIPVNCFSGCTSLASVSIPEVKTLEANAFKSCEALVSIDLPSAESIGSNTFQGCTSITAVTFGPLESVGSNSFSSWTFYASDGTTTIDKTAASNLAGKTFQGTAAALIEVTPGLLSLTPQQIQQVHLHDTELQDLKDQISIDPLPLQPSLQEQELTA